jgi:hypothetical protein
MLGKLPNVFFWGSNEGAKIGDHGGYILHIKI